MKVLLEYCSKHIDKGNDKFNTWFRDAARVYIRSKQFGIRNDHTVHDDIIK